MEKIAIIGSNSFSGAYFAAHCLKQGFSVLGISRSHEPQVAFIPYRWKERQALAKNFQFCQLDINTAASRISKEIDAFGATLIVNFAAQSMVAQSWENPTHWYQTNLVGHTKLLEELRKLPKLSRYVQVSTPEVYGNCSGTVTEAAPFSPSTPYAVSKAACDLHLQVLHRQYKFPVLFTRAANVYGPGQPLYRIVPRTAACIAFGKKLELHGGGHSVRSFIHAQDVATATLAVLKKGTLGECYHISTDRFITIKDLVSLICKEAGARFEDVVEIVDDRPAKDAAYLLSSEKLRNNLGWEDRIALEEGIKQTIAWVNQFSHELKSTEWNYVHKE